MPRFRLMVAAAALTVAGAGTGYAADLGTPIPSYTPPPVYTAPSVFSWTGPYAGALLGYGFGGFTGPAVGTTGITAGAFLGYNFQAPNNVVIGAEMDGLWSGRSDGTPANRVRWESSFRPRVGYAFDRFLPYVTGGLAIAGVTSATTPGTSTEVGWTVGAGADVAFTDRLFGRAEYLYANYGTVAGTPRTLATHEVRIGLGIKF